MMKRGFFIAAMLLLTLCAWGNTNPATVKIGVNIGLSGIGSTASTHELQQAIMLAQKQLNEREDSPYRYELLFEDNKGTPAGAAHAAQKLITIDKADALITIYDFAVAATLPIIESNKIPSIGFGWGVEYAKPPYSILFGYSEIASADTLYEGLKDEDLPTTIIAINQASLPRFVKQMQQRAGLRTAQDQEMIEGAVVFLPAKPNTDFISAYENFTGHAPLDNDPYGYDSLMMLAQSLESALPSDLPMRE